MHSSQHSPAERSEAKKCAVWHLALRMFIFVVRHVLGPGGPPGRHSGNEYTARQRIISLGNECTAVMTDMVAFVACCVVSPVVAELRQREELFVIR